MKYMIASDIHGSATCCEKLLSYFTGMKCDYLIFLGDLLNHGPRNPLPEGHNPMKVVELLNPFAWQILACRGNCDADVDQMLMQFPLLSDYTFVVDDGIRMFCSHGHIYSPERADGTIAVEGSSLPKIAGPAAVFYGHTHIQVLEKNKAGILVCNPGSTSLPKAGSAAGFAVYENRQVTLYDMAGTKLAVSDQLSNSGVER